jgi:hypothetical protein
LLIPPLTVSNFRESVPRLKEKLSGLLKQFVGGQIRLFLPAWENLTSDKFILQSVKGVEISFDNFPLTIAEYKNPHFTQLEKDIISAQITTLLSKQIIEPSFPETGQHVSPIFITEKRDGGYRLILNLKEFNKNVEYQHFKMHGIPEITNLVTKNCFMASVDIKDAYYSVPIHTSFRKYLKFKWNGELYTFCALPNGLSSAPRLFTKLLKPPLATLRSKHHISSAYIDDIYLQGETKQECVDNISDTVNLLANLGLFPHPEKCNFEVSQKIDILGFTIDSVNMIITVTNQRMTGIITHLKSFILKERVKIRELASVIGKLVATFPGVTYGPLYYRSLEADKQQALIQNFGKFEKFTSISSRSKRELSWWIGNLPTAYKCLQLCPPSVTMSTDACDTGWRAYVSGKETHGHWSLLEQDLHINEQEALAVLFGLKSMLNHIFNQNVKLFIDNTAAIGVIKNMGTSHSSILNGYSQDIWKWGQKHNVWFFPTYVPSEANLADKPSRKTNMDAEWQLNPKLFSKIVKELNFVPTIDLFASRLNTQLEDYYSYQPDPQSAGTDAFSFSWKSKSFYCFPPFSCISRCLQKIRGDEAKGIIVVPKWPTQPFYPLLHKLLMTDPVLLKRDPRSLLMPNQPELTSPMGEKTDFLACLVSGRP